MVRTGALIADHPPILPMRFINWPSFRVSSTSGLLAFRGFPHDPQGVLTTVYQLALVGIKLCLNVGIFELSVASAFGKSPWPSSAV
jgi:hypothetical protein